MLTYLQVARHIASYPAYITYDATMHVLCDDCECQRCVWPGVIGAITQTVYCRSSDTQDVYVSHSHTTSNHSSTSATMVCMWPGHMHGCGTIWAAYGLVSACVLCTHAYALTVDTHALLHVRHRRS